VKCTADDLLIKTTDIHQRGRENPHAVAKTRRLRRFILLLFGGALEIKAEASWGNARVGGFVSFFSWQASTCLEN
jgi:hypothetical protein